MGKYIVIEGHDGVGKTTQTVLLTTYLRRQGKSVIHVSEPGGCLSGDLMRIIVKNREFGLDGISNFLIFTANRRELWQKAIAPALKQGKWVIGDRNWWSSVAFQHFGQNVPLDTIENITKSSLPKEYIEPDFGLILNLRDDERERRLKMRLGTLNRDAFESRNTTFQDKVRKGYNKTAKLYHIPIVDATPTPDEIHEEIVSLLKKSLPLS